MPSHPAMNGSLPRSRRYHDEVVKPRHITHITWAGWRHALLRMWRGFFDHACWDLAAGLTFFAVTSTLPLLVALVSILGAVDQARQAVDMGLDLAATVVPDEVLRYIRIPVEQAVTAPQAGLVLVLSVLGSLFTASAWVTAFSRAVNRIYETQEMRPIWALRPLMFVVTIALVLLLALGALVLLASPSLLTWASTRIGLEQQTLAVWSALRWALLIALPVGAVALLLYVTPNVRQPGWRWTWPGALLAIGLSGLTLSGLFRWVEAFGDATFNRTYGALASPLVAVLCLFAGNLALILGVELNAGIERVRELQGGVDAVGRIQLPPVSCAAGPRLARLRAGDARAARALLVSGGRTSDPRRAEEWGAERAAADTAASAQEAGQARAGAPGGRRADLPAGAGMEPPECSRP